MNRFLFFLVTLALLAFAYEGFANELSLGEKELSHAEEHVESQLMNKELVKDGDMEETVWRRRRRRKSKKSKKKRRKRKSSRKSKKKRRKRKSSRKSKKVVKIAKKALKWGKWGTKTVKTVKKASKYKWSKITKTVKTVKKASKYKWSKTLKFTSKKFFFSVKKKKALKLVSSAEAQKLAEALPAIMAENEDKDISDKVSNLAQCQKRPFDKLFDDFCLSWADITDFGVSNLSKVVPNKAARGAMEGTMRLLQNVNELMFDPKVCIGNFDGEKIKDEIDVCGNTLPKNGQEYGLVSIEIPGFPCLHKSTDINFCVVFDDCGGFNVEMDAGLISCIAAMVPSAGVTQLAGQFEDAVSSFSFGISTKANMDISFNLATYSPSKGIYRSEKTMNVHYYDHMGIQIPTDFLTNGKLDLSEYIEISGTVTRAFNFGKIASQTNRFIKKIKDVSGDMNPKKVEEIFKALPSGIELLTQGKISCEIKMEDFTAKFIENIEFDAAQADLFVTTGSGSSGVGSGFYLAVEFHQPHLLFLKKHLEFYESVLAGLGFKIKLPNIFDGKTQINVFIQGDRQGFQLIVEGVASLDCVYHKNKGSCSFEFDGLMKFFTAIKDAAKWVFKTAEKLWDETGEIMMEFVNDPKGFSKKVYKEVGHAAKKYSKIVADKLDDVLPAEVGEFAGDAADHTVKFTKNVANEIANSDVGKTIGKGAKSVGKAIGKGAKSAGKAFGKAIGKAGKFLGIR